VVSFLGDFIGINVEVNLINALIAGFFGIPGVIVLVLAKFLF
jgi:inhibitor of the pro-sigma K processing machinery